MCFYPNESHPVEWGQQMVQGQRQRKTSRVLVLTSERMESPPGGGGDPKQWHLGGPVK